jgi:cell division protein FtsI/penicillin-binding protein 2
MVEKAAHRRVFRLALLLLLGVGLGRTSASLAQRIGQDQEPPPVADVATGPNAKAAEGADESVPLPKLPQRVLALATLAPPQVKPAPAEAAENEAQPSPGAAKTAAEAEKATLPQAPTVPFVGTDPLLSQKMRWLFQDYEIPEAAVVVLDVKTGEVLAAEGYRDGKVDKNLVERAKWPAASVFKIVTAAGLLGQGLSPKTELCFSGGRRKVSLKQLNAKSGGNCASMEKAFSRSYNVPFARWADQKLDRLKLAAFASSFGFGDGSLLGLPATAAGQAWIPDDRLEYARTAAGFGDVTLSPLHGATLAAAIAAGGQAPAPNYGPTPEGKRTRILPESHANQLKNMMVATVKSGSARRSFTERRKRAMGKHGAGGKTGSLFVQDKDLTWFVGFAPAENPEVAVATYVVNGPKWRVRAAYVGRAALRSRVLGTQPYRPTQDPLLAKK